GAVEPAWRKYFDSLPQADWPQLTSAGTLAAPAEFVPEAPLPVTDSVTGSQRALSVAHVPAASPSVFFPPGAENLPFVAPRPVAGRPSFPPSSEMLAATQLQARLSALINAYRVRGHLYAKLDPLG